MCGDQDVVIRLENGDRHLVQGLGYARNEREYVLVLVEFDLMLHFFSSSIEIRFCVRENVLLSHQKQCKRMWN